MKSKRNNSPEISGDEKYESIQADPRMIRTISTYGADFRSKYWGLVNEGWSKNSAFFSAKSYALAMQSKRKVQKEILLRRKITDLQFKVYTIVRNAGEPLSFDKLQRLTVMKKNSLKKVLLDLRKKGLVTFLNDCYQLTFCAEALERYPHCHLPGRLPLYGPGCYGVSGITELQSFLFWKMQERVNHDYSTLPYSRGDVRKLWSEIKYKPKLIERLFSSFGCPGSSTAPRKEVPDPVLQCGGQVFLGNLHLKFRAVTAREKDAVKKLAWRLAITGPERFSAGVHGSVENNRIPREEEENDILSIVKQIDLCFFCDGLDDPLALDCLFKCPKDCVSSSSDNSSPPPGNNYTRSAGILGYFAARGHSTLGSLYHHFRARSIHQKAVVRKTVSRLLKDGKIERTERGVYSLVTSAGNCKPVSTGEIRVHGLKMEYKRPPASHNIYNKVVTEGWQVRETGIQVVRTLQYSNRYDIKVSVFQNGSIIIYTVPRDKWNKGFTYPEYLRFLDYLQEWGKKYGLDVIKQFKLRYWGISQGYERIADFHGNIEVFSDIVRACIVEGGKNGPRFEIKVKNDSYRAQSLQSVTDALKKRGGN
ncbi:MAG: hypothetical protein ACFFD4_02395 [Candidatus Odinarchaeota archaeon]